jgi:hypothetical protein
MSHTLQDRVKRLCASSIISTSGLASGLGFADADQVARGDLAIFELSNRSRIGRSSTSTSAPTAARPPARERRHGGAAVPVQLSNGHPPTPGRRPSHETGRVIYELDVEARRSSLSRERRLERAAPYNNIILHIAGLRS